MLEFCIGFLIGTVYTFVCIIAGSFAVKEGEHEEKKSSAKNKKYVSDKR